jgi:putative transposase
MVLRDLLVTENTKKNLQAYKEVDNILESLKKQKKECSDKEEQKKLTDAIKNIQKERRDNMKNFTAEKNSVVKDFELNTPKDIRANAVKRCCDAYTSGFANLRNGNIKFFRLEYKKKTRTKQSIELTPKNITVRNGVLKILPTYFKDDCILKTSKNNKKKLQNLNIVSNVDLIRLHNCYYVHLCVPVNQKSKTPTKQICGVDLGVRTFATVCSYNIETKQTSAFDYQQRQDILTTLNAKIDMLKKRRGKQTKKKQYKKIEKKKNNIVDLLHWQTVNHLLEHNDVIFLGDIKSHNIVKGNKNKALNRLFNDMKMYQFKQKLLFKASVAQKVVYLVKEHNTTKCCSSCGTINNVGCSKEFCCKSCAFATGRDVNASKNILMKGLLLL